MAKKKLALNHLRWHLNLKTLVGEIVLNSIDHDGMMDGYDFELIDSVRDAISTPLTVLGGAGSLDDISSLYKNMG